MTSFASLQNSEKETWQEWCKKYLLTKVAASPNHQNSSFKKKKKKIAAQIPPRAGL